MQQLKTVEGKRKERVGDLKQVELATLAEIYKLSLGVTFIAMLAFSFYGGWQAKQASTTQQQLNQLNKAVNDALYEVRNGSALEADRILTGALGK